MEIGKYNTLLRPEETVMLAWQLVSSKQELLFLRTTRTQFNSYTESNRLRTLHLHTSSWCGSECMLLTTQWLSLSYPQLSQSGSVGRSKGSPIPFGDLNAIKRYILWSHWISCSNKSPYSGLKTGFGINEFSYSVLCMLHVMLCFISLLTYVNH